MFNLLIDIFEFGFVVLRIAVLRLPGVADREQREPNHIHHSKLERF